MKVPSSGGHADGQEVRVHGVAEAQRAENVVREGVGIRWCGSKHEYEAHGHPDMIHLHAVPDLQEFGLGGCAAEAGRSFLVEPPSSEARLR